MKATDESELRSSRSAIDQDFTYVFHVTPSKRAIAVLLCRGNINGYIPDVRRDFDLRECKCMRVQFTKERATACWRAIGHCVYRNSEEYRCLPVITLDREEPLV